MKKRGVITSGLLLLLWYAFFLAVRNEFIFPSPITVANKMFFDIFDSRFYYIVFSSVLRLCKGLLLSVVFGVSLGLLSGLSKKLSDYLAPINAILKAIPNMSYMIILLIWFGAENSVIFVSFLVLFPIIYTNIQTGIGQLNQDLKNVLSVYPASFFTKVKKIYFPQILPYLWASLKIACVLGLRICIMAEVLSQVRIGVGRQIYYAKNILDMAGIFSWTIWMILLSMGMDVFLEKIKYLFKIDD